MHNAESLLSTSIRPGHAGAQTGKHTGTFSERTPDIGESPGKAAGQQPAAFPRIEVEHKESVGRTDLQAHRFPGAGMDDLPIDGGEDALDDLIVPIQLDVALGR